ncbi:hypothetical protein [Actinomycetospora termitidis]|uniref:Uncharacterized protein n=1 Tax=Actinomycetospora termitidis TaxID=3053470 RepID=A0ABT7MDG4_9PSEU|nr:hypothetical protein [Actinomycetospora sp. Odt1-22]MDL5158707.1 hypothetical protein [Actinomycetospora sp. Odt1-22]
MSTRDTGLRALHDIGLAAWFGGSLFGVAGLNAAAAEADQQRTTARITSVGWAKWSPVNTALIGAHLVGGAGLLVNNRKRAAAQKGATGTTVAKLVLTGAALAATAYTRVVGKKVEDQVVHQSPGMSSSATSHLDRGTTQAGRGGAAQAVQELDKQAGQTVSQAAEALPIGAAEAQRQLRYLQLSVPALTGALLVLNAQAGEQQKPGDQILGVARRAANAVGVAA